MKIYSSETAPFHVCHRHIKASEIYNYLDPLPEVLKLKQDFYRNLEESILADGVWNPVCVIRQRIHSNPAAHYMQLDDELLRMSRRSDQPSPENGVMTVLRTLGGSRLYIGQKHNLVMPVIIADFTKTLPHELPDADSIRALFRTPPALVHYKSFGVCVSPESAEGFYRGIGGSPE